MNQPIEKTTCRERSGDIISIDAERLLKRREQVILTFRGEEYRLRKTRNNKLLLTK